jgi:hypothetical protein
MNECHEWLLLLTLASFKKSYGPLFGFIPKEEMQKVCQL